MWFEGEWVRFEFLFMVVCGVVRLIFGLMVWWMLCSVILCVFLNWFDGDVLFCVIRGEVEGEGDCVR